MKIKLKLNKFIWALLFILPALILYTILIIIPVFFSAYYSLTDWKGIGAPVFRGISNYLKLFRTPDYWKVILNTLQMLLASMFLQVPMGIFLAYLLFRKTRGFKIFRAIFFVPVVVAPIAIGIMFSIFYNSDVGPLNQLLEMLGLGAWKQNWLSDAKIVVKSVIFPQIWQYVGYTLVIVFAAMQAIDQEILESAEMDGANAFTMFGRIVIPMSWDAIVVAVVLVITGSLKSFDYSWAITQGGPGNASSMLAVYMYKTAFVKNNFGLGSSVSMTIIFLSAIMTYLFKKVANSNQGA